MKHFPEQGSGEKCVPGAGPTPIPSPTRFGPFTSFTCSQVRPCRGYPSTAVAPPASSTPISSSTCTTKLFLFLSFSFVFFFHNRTCCKLLNIPPAACTYSGPTTTFIHTASPPQRSSNPWQTPGEARDQQLLDGCPLCLLLELSAGLSRRAGTKMGAQHGTNPAAPVRLLRHSRPGQFTFQVAESHAAGRAPSLLTALAAASSSDLAISSYAVGVGLEEDEQLAFQVVDFSCCKMRSRSPAGMVSSLSITGSGRAGC